MEFAVFRGQPPGWAGSTWSISSQIHVRHIHKLKMPTMRVITPQKSANTTNHGIFFPHSACINHLPALIVSFQGTEKDGESLKMYVEGKMETTQHNCCIVFYSMDQSPFM